MISFFSLFWILLVFFAIIGATRGRTKEFIVSLSAIVGIFLNLLLETYVGFYRNLVAGSTPASVFIMRTGILLLVVIMGYVTPALPQVMFRADGMRPIGRIRNLFWGTALGGLNGYLIVGSILFYLNTAGYPFPFMLPPDPAVPAGAATLNMISRMPPAVLTPPGIYFALVIAFVIVIGAFI
jgi:Colicin V production protein